MAKVYTKKGDSGTTSLLSGTRISKIDDRIKAVGVLDELNSFIGLLGSKFDDTSIFETLQWNLFNAGSMIINDNSTNLVELTENDVTSLENNIDELDKQLPVLKNFILPIGNEKIALTHICRTITRRAEIACLEANSPLIITKYLNRLSDYFFMLCRFFLHQDNVDEKIWKN
jgi:cob(I)alamin adenosyltransferase